ncbi:hypothetical protein [Paracoccus methylarcula]|uniref:Uncharacterized protein n=1 Tax=Paracoccus methylarcula TaxID=72022 RepID=A0A422QYA8_9RHOB|nr:hypothetical protein [Paracoccus methylarcula]RNF34978.1 hypothetical protein A7A09_008290 [Paracoccus methylarcula]
MTSFSAADSTGSALSQARNLLALAASPVFAVMAWVEAGEMGAVCSPGMGILPIGSMSIMYLLMSLFHLSAWLKRGPHGSRTNIQPTTEGD